MHGNNRVVILLLKGRGQYWKCWNTWLWSSPQLSWCLAWKMLWVSNNKSCFLPILKACSFWALQEEVLFRPAGRLGLSLALPLLWPFSFPFLLVLGHSARGSGELMWAEQEEMGDVQWWHAGFCGFTAVHPKIPGKWKNFVVLKS